MLSFTVSCLSLSCIARFCFSLLESFPSFPLPYPLPPVPPTDNPLPHASTCRCKGKGEGGQLKGPTSALSSHVSYPSLPFRPFLLHPSFFSPFPPSLVHPRMQIWQKNISKFLCECGKELITLMYTPMHNNKLMHNVLSCVMCINLCLH